MPRRRPQLAATLLAALLALAACDRGSAPEQLGKPAPTFALQDGPRTADLAKLRGSVVVLNFWASWCAPCLEELPSLTAMQHQLPQVHLLAISEDTDPEAYSRFITQHHVDFATIRDSAQTVNAAYGSFRYPETYVIDKTGLIRRKFIGPQDWTSPEITTFLRKLSQ